MDCAKMYSTPLVQSFLKFVKEYDLRELAALKLEEALQQKRLEKMRTLRNKQARRVEENVEERRRRIQHKRRVSRRSIS